MEEVPAHVHSGPIVPDVLTRQHEHKFGLIWGGDRETSITNLQCRRFGINLFRAYNRAPCKLIDIIDRTGLGRTSVHGSFRGCTTDRGSPSPTLDLGLVKYFYIAASATLAVYPDPLAPLGKKTTRLTPSDWP
ncbi:hypothetical protein M9H77_29972 [Catharanthus roseus]|uniref:Uncharacterized protein n=1 Tax=Catharanthus roseus TaxID=4058 RepID=A0ACB9ZWZ7_CATRO|nr:hypothetical protein M9H77_29972 [Catharanthus roseus]